MTCLRTAGIIGLLFAVAAIAQESQDHPSPEASPTRAQAQRPGGPPLRIDVDLVLVNATVTDSANRFVKGLTQQQFRVWEDKIEQPIEYFSAENVPVSVGIVFDISGSMENKLRQARAAASTFLRMSDREDEYFLIQFSDAPHTVQDFTSDISKIQSPLLFNRAKGSTSLYDALYLGLDKVVRGGNSRKAILLITDGEDNHSRYSFADVRRFAKEHDVVIYAIGIVDEGNPQSQGYAGRAVLEDLANLSGGIAFFPQSLNSLENICEHIGLDLKNQYLIGYRPLNLAADGKWRKIRLKVDTPKGMPSLKVRAKSGYYASSLAKVVK